jgi:hypothetical protein
MNKVIGGMATAKVVSERFDVVEVDRANTHAGTMHPFTILQLLGRAYKAANGVARVEQAGREPSADITSDARDCNALIDHRY